MGWFFRQRESGGHEEESSKEPIFRSDGCFFFMKAVAVYCQIKFSTASFLPIEILQFGFAEN